MDATDHFAGAFERHVAELVEVKDALRELAVDQRDPKVAAQLEELASRLDALTQEMGKAVAAAKGVSAPAPGPSGNPPSETV
jgi:hypothetical protein